MTGFYFNHSKKNIRHRVLHLVLFPIFIFSIAEVFAFARSTPSAYGPTKEKDFESNLDCHSDRCISYQHLDNRNPPTIKTANAFITSVFFPIELSRCDWGADKVYAITAVFSDGNAQSLEPAIKAPFPFQKIKLTVKPDLLSAAGSGSGPSGSEGEGSHKKGSGRLDLYNLPRTNLQCDDILGRSFDIMLVTNPYPHHQVRLDFKENKERQNQHGSQIIKLLKRFGESAKSEDEKKGESENDIKINLPDKKVSYLEGSHQEDPLLEEKGETSSNFKDHKKEQPSHSQRVDYKKRHDGFIDEEKMLEVLKHRQLSDEF